MSESVIGTTLPKQRDGLLNSLKVSPLGNVSELKPLVYIAGPYTVPDPVENTHKAIHLGMLMYEQGDIAPIIPHVSLLMHMVEPKPYQFWLDYDLDFLPHCHALFRMAGESKGADEEVRWAETHRIPVFYDLRRILSWARAWRELSG